MGFFKDFKEDLSQAVGEISNDAAKFAGVADTPIDEIADDTMVDTLQEECESDLTDVSTQPDNNTEDAIDAEIEANLEQALKNVGNVTESEPVSDTDTIENIEPSDETAIITKGLTINGDITSAGSIELLGKVEGNINCQGKLVVSGTIKGDTSSATFYAEKANITGDVKCNGPAKIGNGSVIVGNLFATSAVIAGAIKGDIDVHGPVIVDTTAIVMGNIKSKLVQINNGAVIEGYCSQCYSDNSPKKFFGED